MSQNSAFDVKIPQDYIVQFEREATFENFIGQFQPICSKLLCVVNGTSLHYYDKRNTPSREPRANGSANSLPKEVRFDYKQRRDKVGGNSLTEYYFRDIGNDNLYCVFGREAARIFYPRIDEVDPSGKNDATRVFPPFTIQENPIIQPAIPPERPHYKEQVCQRGEAGPNDRPPLPIKKIPRKNEIINQVVEPNRPKRPPIVNPITRSVTRAEPDRPSKPDAVVIVDRGVKLTFPNPNYPIEIRTYRPHV